MNEFFRIELQRKAGILINSIWAVLLFINITFGIAIFTLPENAFRYAFFILVAWITGIFLFFLTKKGHVRLSAFLYIGLLLLLIFGGAWTGGGIKGHGLKLLPVVVLFAGLTLEKKGIWLFTILASLCGLALVLGDHFKLLPRTEPLGQTAFIHWMYSTTCIFLVAFLAYLAVKELKRSLWETREELMQRKKLEEKYRLIFESFPDIYYQADIGGQLLVVSPSVKACIGYETSEVISKNVTEFYSDPEAGKIFLHDLQTKGHVQNYELDIVTKAGNIINTIISSRLIHDESGIPRIVEGTIHDITKLKKAEELLKIQNKNLIEIAFLQAHMVRRPVASILGLISLVNFKDPGNPINFEILSRLELAAKEFDSSVKEIVAKTEKIQTITTGN